MEAFPSLDILGEGRDGRFDGRSRTCFIASCTKLVHIVRHGEDDSVLCSVREDLGEFFGFDRYLILKGKTIVLGSKLAFVGIFCVICHFPFRVDREEEVVDLLDQVLIADTVNGGTGRHVSA